MDTAPVASSPAGPVIVLAAARSGGTLLRVILDTHPDLAIPGHTDLAATCTSLLRLWRRVGGTDPGDSRQPPPEITARMRDAVDSVYDSYLAARGKKRWGDKSVETIGSAQAIARVFPEAQFVCVYRHALDVVDSTLEAQPWGLSRPELRPFAERFPTNLVQAAAAYWNETTQQLMAFEQRMPRRCYRVQYEDLVSEPESCVAGVLDFIGLPADPDITTRAFQVAHDSAGGGDYKIWATDRIHAESVGRGQRLSISALDEDTRREMNRLLTSLGYESARRGRAAVTAPSWEAPQVSADDDELDEFSETLHEQLVDKLEAMTWLPPEWSALTQGRPIKLTVVPRPDMGPPRHWLIDLTPVNLTLCRFEPVGGEAVAVTTDPATLADVVAGELNLATAISRRQVHLTAGAAARESGDGPGREDARVRLQLLAYLFVDAMSPPAPPGAASPPVADSDDAEPEADAGSEGPDDLAAEASPATEPASEPEPPTGDAGDLEHPVATAAEVRS